MEFHFRDRLRDYLTIEINGFALCHKTDTKIIIICCSNKQIHAENEIKMVISLFHVLWRCLTSVAFILAVVYAHFSTLIRIDMTENRSCCFGFECGKSKLNVNENIGVCMYPVAPLMKNSRSFGKTTVITTVIHVCEWVTEKMIKMQ